MVIENRTHTITNKIFEPSHISNLARIFQEEYNTTINNASISFGGTTPVLNFHLKCFDPVSFESDNDDIFKDTSKIYTKSVRTVEMSFSDGTDKRMKLVIQHGEYYDKAKSAYINNSYLEVSGVNDLWVNGTLSKLMDYVESVPTQKRGILNHLTEILWTLIILGDYLLIIALSLNECRNDAHYFLKDTYDTTGFFGLIGVIICLGFVSFVFFAIPILIYIQGVKHTIFPSVELLLGPEHLLITKIKRKRILMVWATIILPVILSIVCNIITNYI